MLLDSNMKFSLNDSFFPIVVCNPLNKIIVVEKCFIHIFNGKALLKNFEMETNTTDSAMSNNV